MALKSGYILPLDGLRAVAILLVLVFHLDHNLLPGGFIGVDIFFVISGFIITRNILAQREEGTFSFMEFYKRRFVRLFPASAVAVLFTIFGATLIYDAETVAGIGRTALYALLSVANIWFWLNSGYFEDVSSQNPLLHMWSLSVEEQFYLVWPALLMVVSLLPGKKTLWLWLVFVVGLIGAWWLASLDPSGAFYLMPARIFQFAIGAALAAIAFRPSAFVSGISLLSGFVLIGISAAFANGELYEFFIAAVIPTFGAALAIFGLNNRLGDSLLGNVVMRAIGLRAYSIYLVHWPIAVFAGTLIGPNRSLAENFGLLVLCLIAGDVLYRMVEKPLRLPSTAPTPGPDFSGIRVSTTLLLLAGGLAISAHTWALNRTGSQAQPSIIADAGKIAPNAADPAALFWANVSKESISAQTGRFWSERSAMSQQKGKDGCALAHKAPYSEFRESCRLSDQAGPKFLLMGDSLSPEALGALEGVLPYARIAVAATPGCLPEYPEPGWDSRPIGCQELNKRRFEWVTTDEFSGVILTANWRWINKGRFEAMVMYLKQHNKPLIVFGPRPQFSETIPGILTSVAGVQAADNLDKYLSYDFRERSKELEQVLETSGVDYVYIPWGEMLYPDQCRAYLPTGELAYLDQMHIPPHTSRWIGKQVASRYGESIRKLFIIPEGVD